MTATTPSPRQPTPRRPTARRPIAIRPAARRMMMIVVLTLIWCGLWQDLSAANLAGGAAIAIGVLSLGVGTSGDGGVRLRPLLHLVWIVIVDLVASTVDVAKEVLTPTDRTDEAIVALQLRPDARQHLLLLIVAITLTPGTAVVDADPDSGVLYLHLLHHHRRAAVEAHVHQLTDLACLALPTERTDP